MFETRDRRELYDFIDSRGEVTYDDLVESDLLTDPDRYRQLVAVMKRDGILEEDDGTLRPALSLDNCSATSSATMYRFSSATCRITPRMPEMYSCLAGRMVTSVPSMWCVSSVPASSV